MMFGSITYIFTFVRIVGKNIYLSISMDIYSEIMEMWQSQ